MRVFVYISIRHVNYVNYSVNNIYTVNDRVVWYVNVEVVNILDVNIMIMFNMLIV